MNVSIFGLGYVGATLTGCLARSGHTVFGVDPAVQDADALLNSRAVCFEADLRDYIAYGLETEKINIANDPSAAIRQSDVTLVCVGTPPDLRSHAHGALMLDQLQSVVTDIARALHGKSGFHLVVVRSTVLPGTTRSVIAPLLEHESQRQIAKGDLNLVFQPEFLREGSACADFFTPPMTVFAWAGTFDFRIDPLAFDMLKELYVDVDSKWLHMELEGAEVLKLVCNAWHALKVAFANEIGSLCAENNIDGAQVMDVFARDHKLNLSPAYLRPGFAYGGPCLSKDLAALLSLYWQSLSHLPLLEAVHESNVFHIERVVDRIEQSGKQRVGVVGIAHKSGSGDLRSSAALMLIDRLRGVGYQVVAYDDSVSRTECPIAVESLAELAGQSDVIVLLDPRFKKGVGAIVSKGCPVIDFSS